MRMPVRLSFLLRVLVPVALALLAIQALSSAGTLAVDCGSGGSINAAINALFAGGPGPHTITVTGNCTELVEIINRDGLTIEAASLGSATISSPTGISDVAVVYLENSHSIKLSRLVIEGSNQPVEGVYAEAGSQVTITECTIQHNLYDGVAVGGNSSAGITKTTIANNEVGVFSDQSTVSLLGMVTIQNNNQDAMVVSGGRGDIRSPVAGGSANVIRNNGYGVGFVLGAIGSISRQNTIANNGPYGLLVGRRCDVSLGSSAAGGTTIEGHSAFGVIAVNSIVAFSAPAGTPKHQVRNNGNAAAGLLHAGIFGTRNTSVRLFGAAVTNNAGPGVLMDPSGTLTVADSEISGNTGDGILLQHLSVAEFGNFDVTGATTPANTIISGNGGAAVTCDATSVVYGDLGAISPIKCVNSTSTTKDKKTGAAAAAADLETRLLERRRGSR